MKKNFLIICAIILQPSVFISAGILPTWVRRELRTSLSNGCYDKDKGRKFELERKFDSESEDKENKVWKLDTDGYDVNGELSASNAGELDFKKICLDEGGQFFVHEIRQGCSSVHNNRPRKVSNPTTFLNRLLNFEVLKNDGTAADVGEMNNLQTPLFSDMLSCQVECITKDDFSINLDSLPKINFLLVRIDHPKYEFTTFLLDTDDAIMDKNGTVIDIKSAFIVHSRRGKDYEKLLKTY